ncbi:MAG TPA: hypothetical protein VIM30_10675 [Candidatus Limnocylindrales bacterium]
MDQDLTLAQQLPPRDAHVGGRDVKDVEHALSGIVRRRRALPKPEPANVVLDDEVGEGATDVDCQSHASERLRETG